MKLTFATLFDINYLSRGLLLLDSLKDHSSAPFKLFVLALDDEVISYFLQHPTDLVETIEFGAVEAYFPELQRAKNNRSKIEYYFTLSPYLPLYILDKYPAVTQITTMDADLFFFNDPITIFKEYPDASILITPHNFSPELTYLAAYGKYNVSFQSFKNDVDGRKCLEDWRNNCLTWCNDYLDEENNRFADQKYLDTWKEKFNNVQDITIPGTGIAPWNINNHKLLWDNNKLTVDNHPFIYYHFHELRLFNSGFALNGLETYKVQPNSKPVKYIYHTYLKKLSRLSKNLAKSDNNIHRGYSVAKYNFPQKLKNPTGYWLFAKYFIVHLNPSSKKKKIKALFSFFNRKGIQ